MKTNYSILFIAGAIILLTSCAYDGISGSSGSSSGDPTPVDINGLWIQAQSTTLTEKDAPSCGCKENGLSGGTPRRCFNYFGNSKVVSGYLTIPGSSDNCDVPLDQASFDANKESLFSLIDAAIKNDAGSSQRVNNIAAFVPGNFKIITREQDVSIQRGSNSTDGVYFNIDYPTGVVGKANLFIVCSAYAPGDDENELFIAAEESGGFLTQPPDVDECNSVRHTDLVKYTKYDR